MKLDYQYKTATVEEATTVLPPRTLPATHHSPLSGTEGVLLNADVVTTSEVAAWYQSPDARLREMVCAANVDGASERKGNRLEFSSTGEEPSPLTTTREPTCPPGCRVCFLARKYGLTPREVTLIALISSGKSGRAISQTLGIGMPTIRRYCSIIHGKIGTRSRLAIGLWAIREGMVKTAVQPVDRV
jgi:DNA-binding CsgD family transcriptional regulator